MGSWPLKAHIDGARWCVAVGSPSPRRAAAPKGTGVHWLKGDVSWVGVSGEASYTNFTTSKKDQYLLLVRKKGVLRNSRILLN